MTHESPDRKDFKNLEEKHLHEKENLEKTHVDQKEALLESAQATAEIENILRSASTEELEAMKIDEKYNAGKGKTYEGTIVGHHVHITRDEGGDYSLRIDGKLYGVVYFRMGEFDGPMIIINLFQMIDEAQK